MLVILVPSILSLLLSLDSQLFNFVNFRYISRFVLRSLLLKIGLLDLDRESRSNVALVEPLEGHIYTLNIGVADAGISLGLISLFILVNVYFQFTSLCV